MADYSEVPHYVLEIAKSVIKEHHPKLDEWGCRIGFVFQEKATKVGGKTKAASITKISPALHIHLDLDYLVKIAEDVWEGLDSQQRRALIDHELCHILFGNNGWTIKAHDIEEFKEIIDRYGLWRNDLMYVADSFVEAQRQLTFITLEHEGKVVTVDADTMDRIAESL